MLAGSRGLLQYVMVDAPIDIPSDLKIDGKKSDGWTVKQTIKITTNADQKYFCFVFKCVLLKFLFVCLNACFMSDHQTLAVYSG